MERKKKKLVEDIGKHLQKLRKEAGYKTQDDLAIKSSISKSSIGNYESGQNSPSIELLPILMKYLKCNSLDELFEPLLKNIKKDTQLESFIKRIKRIYKIPEAKRKLHDDIDTIEKAYNLKQKNLKR